MSKTVKFGSAWSKVSKKGNDFLSVSVKSKDSEFFVDKNVKTGTATKTRLWLEIDGQEPIQVSNFNVFSNEIDHEKYPTAPQYNVVVILED